MGKVIPKRHDQRLVRTLKTILDGRVLQGKNRRKEFAKRFKTDPLGALEWETEGTISSVLMEQKVDVTLRQVKQLAKDGGVHRVLEGVKIMVGNLQEHLNRCHWRNKSTSVLANLTREIDAEVMATLMQDLNEWSDYVEDELANDGKEVA